MLNFIVYQMSGKILRAGTCQDILLTKQVSNPGESSIEGSCSLDFDYILAGQVVSRPMQAILLDKTTLTANGIDSIAITGAPIGANFTAMNQATKETITGIIDGTDSFSTTIEGTYDITISLFPYLDFKAVINAI